MPNIPKKCPKVDPVVCIAGLTIADPETREVKAELVVEGHNPHFRLFDKYGDKRIELMMVKNADRDDAVIVVYGPKPEEGAKDPWQRRACIQVQQDGNAEVILGDNNGHVPQVALELYNDANHKVGLFVRDGFNHPGDSKETYRLVLGRWDGDAALRIWDSPNPAQAKEILHLPVKR
jgi:hypothetical protein